MRIHLILRCLAGPIWLTVSTGFAPPAAAEGRSELRVGKPAAVLQMQLSEAAEGSVLTVGSARVRLPIRAAKSLRSQSVTLAGGQVVGVVWAGDGAQEAAALVVRRPGGGLEFPWTGGLFPKGDPGERRTDAVEVADRDGDGHLDVVVGVYDERIRICGQSTSLLEPRALDPKSLALRPVLLNRLDVKRASEPVSASASGPASGPPLLRALHANVASSAGPGSDVRALTDGDLASAWVAGQGPAGRFEFVSLRWAAADKPIRALAVVLPAANPAYAGVRRLSISPEQGPRLEVSLPAVAQPGQRYWVVPKAPLETRCLSVSLDELAPAAGGARGAVAEVEAYTDVDTAGGVDSLVREVVQDGPHAADATEWLKQARVDVLPQLSAAWAQLSNAGKRRALRIASARAAESDAAIAFAAAAVRDRDPEVSREALAVIVEQLPRSDALLLQAARESSAAGDDAALAIARSGQRDASALTRLLGVLTDTPRASERSGLRESIALAFKQAGASADVAVSSWLGQPALPVPARAAAGLALASVPEAAASAQRVVSATLAEAREFPDRWRLTRAVAQLPAEPAIDAWLVQQSRTADEWMLRAAALEALGARRVPEALASAKTALLDDYPRVRAMALGVLGGDPASLELVTRSARKDEWFLVRAAALSALPNVASGIATMQEALADASPIVRAAAIRSLRRVRAAAAWPSVKVLVANAEEFPEVISDGIAYARALCIQAAAPTLQEVVQRGLRPEAWTTDQELALSALEALTHLGGAHAKWAEGHAGAPMVPASVRAAATRAVQQPVACTIE